MILEVSYNENTSATLKLTKIFSWILYKFAKFSIALCKIIMSCVSEDLQVSEATTKNARVRKSQNAKKNETKIAEK